LAREIASHLDIGLGRINSTKFNDGEINLQILDSIRDQNVFIIKSFEDRNVNDGIVELLLAVATMKKEGAASVTAIVPFFPYALPSSSEAFSNDLTEGVDFFTCFGADLVKMLEALGCDEIITLNTSMSAPKGFAQSSRFLNVEAAELVTPYLIYSGIKDPVIVGARSNWLHLRTVTQLFKTFGLFNFKCGMGFYNDHVYIG
jgi:ribose-phosphate pyrophosphokinase